MTYELECQIAVDACGRREIAAKHAAAEARVAEEEEALEALMAVEPPQRGRVGAAKSGNCDCRKLPILRHRKSQENKCRSNWDFRDRYWGA